MHRRGAVLAAALALIAVLVLAVPASAGSVLTARLHGPAVVPNGTGANPASEDFTLMVASDGLGVCYSVELAESFLLMVELWDDSGELPHVALALDNYVGGSALPGFLNRWAYGRCVDVEAGLLADIFTNPQHYTVRIGVILYKGLAAEGRLCCPDVPISGGGAGGGATPPLPDTATEPRDAHPLWLVVVSAIALVIETRVGLRRRTCLRGS